MKWLEEKFPINKLVRAVCKPKKKKEKGVLVNKLQSKINTEPAMDFKLPEGCLGIMFVFKNKTTARKFCGNKVGLTQVSLLNE